jgi:hypothetical protein
MYTRDAGPTMQADGVPRLALSGSCPDHRVNIGSVAGEKVIRGNGLST